MNFNDALNVKMEEIERPPLIPVGTYRAVVSKVPVSDTISEGKYDTLDFMLKLAEAQDDVDQDELKEYGPLSSATVRHRFLFNTEDKAMFDRTLYNLKRFLEEHLKVEGGSLKECINNALNHQCLVAVKWRPDKDDPEIQYNEVGKTAPVG